MSIESSSVSPGAPAGPRTPTPAVVVGVDGSCTSREALVAAIGVAERTRGRVVVVHVAQLPPLLGLSPWYVGEALCQVQEDQSRRVFEQTRALVELARRPWSYRSGSGDPAAVISGVAAEEQASCIVVGSRGSGLRAKLHRLIGGSVSRRLARRESRPVLVIHD